MRYWRTPLDKDKIKPIHGHIEVKNERCKGCGICIKFCPRQVLQESEEFNAKGYHPVYAATESACSACGLCEMICPDFVITVTPVQEKKPSYV